MLAEEIEALKPALSGYLNGYPLEILNFISSKNLSVSVDFTNFCIALRIFLTMTVASGERSFSKIKQIKFYLRSTMTQDRLSPLVSLSTLIYEFATTKSRKISL